MVAINEKFIGAGDEVIAEGSRSKVGWEYVKQSSIERLDSKSDLVDYGIEGVRGAALLAFEAIPIALGWMSPRKYQLKTTGNPQFQEPFEGVKDVAKNVRDLNIPGLAINVADVPDRFIARPALGLLPGRKSDGRSFVIVPTDEIN